jgi:hypothetical protein
MQIKGIPNDLFNYHLQFLVKKGLVARSKEGYTLAELGIKRVADTQAEDLFKVNVITVVSRKLKGNIQILSQIRSSHPSFGKIGVMGGVVHKGESLERAAARKLRTETGLDADFRIVGIERRMMHMNEELFSDIIFPIAYADEYRGVLREDTEFGHNMWLPIGEAIKNESKEFDSIQKIADVLKMVRAGKISKMPFFYEEIVQKG